MKEYIEREKLLQDIEHYHLSDGKFQHWVEIQLAADVVSKGLYEQTKWERDVALAQLEEYGVSLGEKADVVKVRRGRWEKHGSKWQCTGCKVLMSIDGTPQENLLYYCPNCGAKMDKEDL